MKTLFRIMTLFLTLFCFAGCDDDEEVLATLDRRPLARRQLLLHYIQPQG